MTRRRFSPRSAPTKSAHHRRRRAPEDLGRRVVLLEHAADVEDRDAVAHLHRLLDVVGDEHDRLAHLALQAQELVLQAHARHRVDGAERLVHQEHGRIGGERARDADPLALPARELRGVALAVLGGIEADELEQLVDPCARCAPSASRAGAARWRRWCRWSGAGTGRPAGSRTRCGGAAPTGSAWVTSSPSRKMRPDVGSISRLIILSVVVLPQPDGPTSTQISPAGISSESSCTATCRSGYCLPHRVEADHGVVRLGDRADGTRGVTSRRPCSPRTSARSGCTGRGSPTTRRDPRAGWSSTSSSPCSRSRSASLIAVAARRCCACATGALYGPVLAITGVLYTIPSLALFAMLVPVTGLSRLDRADPAHALHAPDPRAEHRSPGSTACPRREGGRARAWATRARGSCCGSSCRSPCRRSSWASASRSSPRSGSSR